jgi:hypothetical protein
VKIRGKGAKEWHCPLWPSTVAELTALIPDRAPRRLSFSIAAVMRLRTSASTHSSSGTYARRRSGCPR